jgi:twitching motility protein PilT
LAAAETGHLVFGTIHASGAAQTIGRLLDLFPEAKHAQMRTALAFNLKAIINQKLLPKAEGKGMVAALEIMFISPIVKKLILDGEDAKLAETLARDVEAGSETFNRVLARLYKEKRITMDVALISIST